MKHLVSKYIRLTIATTFIISTSFYAIANFTFIYAAQLSSASDTLSSSNSLGPDAVSVSGVTHVITYNEPGSLVISSSATFTVYIQTGITGSTSDGFSSPASTTLTVKDNGTTVLTGTPVVTSSITTLTSFPTVIFTQITLTGTTTAAITATHTITISGITATNPSSASTNANPYVVDVQDNIGASNEGFLAIPIVTNGAVTVQGTVTPYITLALNSNSVTFGNFYIGVNTATTTTVLTVNTNATHGANLFVYDIGHGSGNPGLYSSTAGYLIPSSSATLATGTEGYGIQATGSGLTIPAPFNGTGNAVGGLTTYSATANPATLATSTTFLNNATATVSYLASVIATTPAGVYNDTVTYTAVGTF